MTLKQHVACANVSNHREGSDRATNEVLRVMDGLMNFPENGRMLRLPPMI